MALIHYVDGEEELYDIVNDPHEWDNVLSENPEVAADLRKWLPKRTSDQSREVDPAS